MNVILYMATTVNGYIAKSDGDSSWVRDPDWEELNKLVQQAGVVVMGRKTYEVAEEEEAFPYEEALNVVMTSSEDLHKESSELENVLFTNSDPLEVIEEAKVRGYEEIVVAGGATVNSAFLDDALIDIIYLSVHPLILGEGIPLFHEFDIEVDLELLGVKTLKEDLALLHYKTIRK